MDELILEPYAAVQTWQLPGATGKWGEILGEYLQTLAQHCTQDRKSVVGHIKAIALFPDESFLQISVIAPDRPATVEGEVPAGAASLQLTLNVLVYGVPREVIRKSTKELASDISKKWKGVVEHQEMKSSGQHTHHLDNQNHKENNYE